MKVTCLVNLFMFTRFKNKEQRWHAPARGGASLERTETKRNKADKS